MLGGGVVPELGRPRRAILGVETDKPMLLARHADAGNLRRSRRFDGLADRIDQSPYPPIGMLLPRSVRPLDQVVRGASDAEGLCG